MVIVVLTNGDKGSNDLNMSSDRLAVIRAGEMVNASAALGATAVQLGYEDGNLINTYEARLRVAAQIRIHRPQLLVSFNPQYNFGHYQLGSEHKDHKTAGAVALDAFYPTARDHLQFKELWDPMEYQSYLSQFKELANLTKPLPGWKVPEAYLFATERLDQAAPRYETVTVELAEATLETKARSLSQHASQTGGAGWQQLLPGIQARAEALGSASVPPVSYAEWFTRVINLP